MKNISFRKRNVQGGSVYHGNTLWLGARRLCKTFLVDQALRGKITFRHAGLSPVDEAGKKSYARTTQANEYESRNIFTDIISVSYKYKNLTANIFCQNLFKRNGKIEEVENHNHLAPKFPNGSLSSP